MLRRPLEPHRLFARELPRRVAARRHFRSIRDRNAHVRQDRGTTALLGCINDVAILRKALSLTPAHYGHRVGQPQPDIDSARDHARPTNLVIT
jgi:hypothetical protein